MRVPTRPHAGSPTIRKWTFRVRRTNLSILARGWTGRSGLGQPSRFLFLFTLVAVPSRSAGRDSGETAGSQQGDSGETVGRQWGDSGETVGRQWGDSEETVGRQWGDSGHEVGPVEVVAGSHGDVLRHPSLPFT